MLFNFNEIALLKDFLVEQNAGYLHTHDTCGGQYFSLDFVDDRIEDLIKNYFLERNIRAIFTEDRLGFQIEAIK